MGYLFTALNYICYCISRFIDDKRYMLTLDLLAKFFTVIGLYFLGSLTGAYNMAVSFILLIVANVKERKRYRWTIGYILFEAAYLTILILTFQGLSSILVFVVSSVTLLNIWWLPPQKMRVIGGCNSFVYLAYQISIKNWAGLLEIAVIISNWSAYFMSKRRYTMNE